MSEFLTDTAIAKLEQRAQRYEVADEKEAGLRLRVYPNGAKTWSYWYRTLDGTRRLKLGKYPTLTLAKAREKAKKLWGRVDDGEDPAGDRNKKRDALRARATEPTFEDVCKAFAAEEMPDFRPATRLGWQRYIDRVIVPKLGKKLPSDITAEDIAEMKGTLARGVRGETKDGKPTWKRKPAPTSARRLYEVVRRVLEWLSAVDPDVEEARKRHGLVRLATNPAATARGYRRKKKRGKTRAAAAAKALTDDQLRAVFGAAMAEVEAATKARKRGKDRRPTAHEVEARAYANLLSLVAHTVVRAHDARAARWEDVDEQRRLWTIASHKTSDHTGAPHIVPLSPGALAVLTRIREANMAAGHGRSKWLFPADTASCEVCERGGHVDKDSKAAKRIKDASGVEGRGLLHRLRHSFKTRASEHGIEGRVSEAILAHVPPGIVGDYDHAELLPHRREALEWWSGELERIAKSVPKGGGRKRARA